MAATLPNAYLFITITIINHYYIHSSHQQSFAIMSTNKDVAIRSKLIKVNGKIDKFNEDHNMNEIYKHRYILKRYNKLKGTAKDNYLLSSNVSKGKCMSADKKHRKINRLLKTKEKLTHELNSLASKGTDASPTSVITNTLNIDSKEHAPKVKNHICRLSKHISNDSIAKNLDSVRSYLFHSTVQNHDYDPTSIPT